jgi:hypothetical protein
MRVAGFQPSVNGRFCEQVDQTVAVQETAAQMRSPPTSGSINEVD